MMPDSSTIITTVCTSAATAAVTALVTSIAAIWNEQRKFRDDFVRDRDSLRTAFMAESVAKSLLEHESYEKRSFEAIKKRIGGFEDDELRKILVRAGALRFEGNNGSELWGLLSRNKAAL